MNGLARGDLLPQILTPPPGPRARELSARLGRAEAPGINTLHGGAPSLLWQEARGANVLDVDGNRYVDLTAGFGVASVGHRHPRVVAAVREQAGRLLHALGDVHAHPDRVELAERLAALVPAGEPGEERRTYPAISGADAVEIAVKTALLATGRSAVVAFDPGYHGVTTGALTLTSRPAFRAPFAAHLHPHLRRLPYGCPAADLAATVDSGVACAVVEPVVGREGVIPPPPGWLADLATACRRAGALLVADEIFTGFGRTGRRFAVEHEEGLRPDLVVCGKALGGGLPLGAVVGAARHTAAWETGGEALHTATFIANPLSCAAALSVLDVLDEEDLIPRAAAWESRLGERLATWPGRHPGVTAVRGRGLLWGLELTGRETAGALVHHANRHGILILAGGPEGRVVQIVPPLTITAAQMDAALDVLEEGLGACAGGPRPS